MKDEQHYLQRLAERVIIHGHADYHLPDGRLLTVYKPDQWKGSLFQKGKGTLQWEDDGLIGLLTRASEKAGVDIKAEDFFLDQNTGVRHIHDSASISPQKASSLSENLGNRSRMAKRTDPEIILPDVDFDIGEKE